MLARFVFVAAGVAAAMALPAEEFAARPVTIKNSNPLIYYHGRWDKSPGTWWAGSGFKLNVKDLKMLTLNLGNHTTAPHATVGVSVDYSEFVNVNVSAGANVIPVTPSKKGDNSVVRINVEGWQNNRMNLESIILNSDAKLLPYKPSKLSFRFIGDSLSAGQFLDKGVDQAWPFLVAEDFKAEYSITAQPGATLTDMVSYGNVHGVSYQFFKTEDTGYIWTADHNYTTPWDFSRERPQATHVVIHIGANDSGQGVTEAAFTETYKAFLAKVRMVYPKQPIFVFTPWGWPNAESPEVYYYYPNAYQEVVDTRHALGDKQVFLVNTTGWVTFADVFPENVHPSEAGMEKVAGLFTKWLENWGLKKEKAWAT